MAKAPVPEDLADRSLAEFAGDRIQHRLKHFRHALQTAQEDPGGKDSVHDLRVGIRRLRECVKAFEGFIVAEDARYYDRALQKLMHACAPVRDGEVMLELLQEAGAGDQLLQHLQNRKDRDRAQLRSALKKWGHRKLAAPLRPASVEAALNAKRPDGIRWDQRSARANAQRHLPAIAEAWRIEGGLAAMPAAIAKEQHGFRIQTKRLRYLLELFEDCFAEAAGNPIKGVLEQLGSIQDQLGAVNDCAVALEYVDDAAVTQHLQALLEKRRARFRTYWARHIENAWHGAVAWLCGIKPATKTRSKPVQSKAR